MKSSRRELSSGRERSSGSGSHSGEMGAVGRVTLNHRGRVPTRGSESRWGKLEILALKNTVKITKT